MVLIEPVQPQPVQPHPVPRVEVGLRHTKTIENELIRQTQLADQPQPIYKCNITAERLVYLKKLVEDAIREQRIFTIKGGWQSMRRALLQRNWVERYDSPKLPKPELTANGTQDDLCSNLPSRQSWESAAAYTAKCERVVMSRLLQTQDVNFYWNMRKDQLSANMRMNCHVMVHRFSRSLFTSKEGLCLLLQQMYWYNEIGLANVNFPRCYVLGFPDHYNNFVDDFRLTACTSLLKYVINKFEATDKFELQSVEGVVPYNSLQFAMDRLNEYLGFRKHLDIDLQIPVIEDADWDAFLTHFKQIVHENKMFIESREFSLTIFAGVAKGILKKLAPYWPQMDLDGMKNLWIIKPGNKCRGKGIQIIKNVKDVAKIMEMKLKYVVQKYIEKPMIIYKTKFDIRQWFLLTSAQPLIIWMYRTSYLRFSSQNFNLDNLHESLHLTNHSVQCRYKNTVNRDEGLPNENMWDCFKFQEYLKDRGHEDKWDSVIFPGMRQSIIGCMLACQDTMDRRPNTFELYGADFLLGEDFTPWLLEINSSPDFSPSTSVTARLCPQCLDDLIRVVVDRRKDPNCDTGAFELIYKQNFPRPPAYLGTSLAVRGRRIFKRKVIKKKEKEKENDDLRKRTSRASKLFPPDIAPSPGESSVTKQLTKTYSGPVIADLMEELHTTFHRDLNTFTGVDIAAPVIKPTKKVKSDVRVPKTNRAAFAKPSNANCSSRKLGAGESCRIPRTAPAPLQQKSFLSRDALRVFHRWKLGSAQFNYLNQTGDVQSDKVATTKTRGKLFDNKGSTHNSSQIDCVAPRRPTMPLIVNAEKRGLLTVGYGLRHFRRPNT